MTASRRAPVRPRIDPCGAVPDDPRPQLRELVGRIPPREHVEHVLELLAGQLGERVRAPDQVVEVVDGDLLVRADRDDLLRQHVERVARDRGLLDRALAHRLRHHGALEQVGPELREDPPLGRRTELVARPADPLQAAGHGLRALDLDDEVDRAHVDPELEAGRRDEARDPARLEVLLDEHPLLSCKRAVVRACDLPMLVGYAAFGVRLCELVDPQCEPLGEPAVVDEHDRRAVRAHQLEQRRVDRGPDRAGRGLVPRVHLHAVRHHGLGQRAVRTQLAEVLHGNDDLEVELLALPRVDQGDLARRPRDPAADLRERTLRGREADPLEGLLDDALEPLERDGEMDAALRARDRVYLVEDHRLDGLEQLAAPGREQQVQRLRRRDQDVGRRPEHPLAVALRRVTRADAHRERRADPGERPPQVALDVVVERLERRDVEQPKTLARRGVQPVDAEEKGREGLPRAGRRLDEDVPARRDRRPGELLRRCRAGEGALEPGPRSR